jgi:phage-related protein
MLVQGAIALVQGLADGLLAALPILIRQLPVIIENVVQSLISSIPLLIQGAIELTNGVISALPEIIMALVEAAPLIIESLVNGLITALPMLIEGSIQLTMLLVTHLPEIIAALIQAIPQLVGSVVTALVNAAPKLLEAAKTMIETLKTGWQNFFPALVNSAVLLFNTLKTTLMNLGKKFIEIGKQIVEGIKQGIANAWDAFKDWVTGLLSGLVDGIKEFFHIGSPSKLMADEIGRWIPAGIAEGIEKGMGLVDNAMSGMSNDILMSARVTAADVPQFAASEMAGSSDDSLYQLLATYLPQIAQGGNVNITLDGDAGRLFRLMQRESVRNTQMVGVNSVLSAI